MSKPANNDIRPSEELPDPGTEKIQSPAITTRRCTPHGPVYLEFVSRCSRRIRALPLQNP
jgi:hypothetical protein